MPRVFAHALVLAVFLFISQTSAQTPPEHATPVVLTADEMTYNEDLGLVLAKGNVEISQGDRLLMADTVTYNQRANTVIASGNVSLVESTGEVIFGDYVELSDDMKDGVIQNLGMLLSDGHSRFAAAGGRLRGGTKRELRNAVYSPCELCQDDPSRAPLWQIKASEVEHDTETHLIKFKDAWFDMFGLPVGYTPYLTASDPTVTRKTGLLAPTFGGDSQLGQLVRIPYFITLGEDKDMTLEPIFMTKERPALAAQYRERFSNGYLATTGSFTNVSETDSTGQGFNANRGHILGTMRFDVDDTWRSGFDGGYTTDQTYLRRYSINSDFAIQNHPFMEGFRGNNYAVAQGYYFQDLRGTVPQRTQPLVLPKLDYNFLSSPDGVGGHWFADADSMVLTRWSGANSRRMSLITGWERPYTTSRGDVWTTSVHWENDLYSVQNVSPENDTETGKLQGITGRSLPQARLDWRNPWVRETGGFRQIIEPVASVILAPSFRNPVKIPNEDSQDFEFDDANLFSLNRFPGIDRVESGPRAIYGIQATALGNHGGMSEAFFGQSYRLDKDNVFVPGSGLSEHLSDYVGRLHISPDSYLDASYRFRFSQPGFNPERTELGVSAGPTAFRLSAVYIDVVQPQSSTSINEQLTLSLGSQMTKHWSTYANHVRNLGANGGPLYYTFGLKYEDECFVLNTAANINYTHQGNDFRPGETVLVTAIFKTLGTLSGQALSVH